MANQPNNLTAMQRITLEVLWIICRGFALLPHCVRHYVFGTACYLILCYILRYRRRVIMDNLRRSFPDKSEKELRKICRGTYRNLAEQIINTISQSGVSDKTLMHRMNVTNADQVCEEIGNRSAIMLTAHFGPWEAGSTVSLVIPDQTFVAVYHKLTSPVADELMKRIRTHTNVELVDMKRTMRHFVDNKDKRPMAMGLIADQNPVLRANMHWYKFLHQWTAFFEGGEILALKYHLPVYYFSPCRISAGHYEGTFTLIYDGEEQVEPYTITERYVRLLENDINAHPEMWMWSHRRWKHTPPAELLSQKI
ncbi:MAG: lysophospholipid acyltransferase family protein [Alistipes sp.]|nr:lysophospholipid acyltransferase family protein [Alistipes sp.]